MPAAGRTAAFSALRLEGWHLSAGLGLRLTFSENSVFAVDVGLNDEPFSREPWALAVRSCHAF